MSEPIKISIEAEGGDKAAEEIRKPAQAVEKAEADITRAEEKSAEARRKIIDRQKNAETPTPYREEGFGRIPDPSPVSGSALETQKKINSELKITEERSLFINRARTAELYTTKQIAEAQASLAERLKAAATAGGDSAGAFSLKGLIKDAPQVISSLRAIAVEAAAVAGPIAAAYSIGTLGARAIRDASKESVDAIVAVDKKFADSTSNYRILLDGLSGSFGEVKQAFTGLGAWVMKKFDDIVLGGGIAQTKLTEQAWKNAKDSTDALEALRAARAQLHAEMAAEGEAFYRNMKAMDSDWADAALANQAKLIAARAELAAGRDQRSGAGAGDAAVGVLERQVEVNQNARAVAEKAVADAVNKANEAWKDSLKFAEEDQSKAAMDARSAYDQARNAAEITESNLQTLIEEQGLRMQNSIEATGDTVNKETETKLTQVANSLKATIDQATASGAPLDGAIQAAKAIVDKVMTDGVAQAEEAKAIGQAANLLRSSSAVTNRQTIDLLNSLASTAEMLAQSQAATMSRVSRVESDVRQLIQRMNTPGRIN